MPVCPEQTYLVADAGYFFPSDMIRDYPTIIAKVQQERVLNKTRGELLSSPGCEYSFK